MTTKTSIEPADLERVLQKLIDDAGVDLTGYRDSTLRRRLHRRLLATRCESVSDYIERLDGLPGEHEMLLRELTVKYTEFFRDPDLFKLLRAEVLPTLLVSGNGDRPLAIWSAGCATGQEAYSLTSIASSAKADCRVSRTIDVVGTDIDAAALESASIGIYPRFSTTKPLPESAAAHFTDDGSKILPGEELRRMVEFYQHDLVASDAGAQIRRLRPERFDLVVCRNVLIYLRRPLQAATLKKLFDALRPGGYLVLGSKETLSADLRPHMSVVSRAQRVYGKSHDVDREVTTRVG